MAPPAAVGLHPDSLAALDANLASGAQGYIDGMLVIRHGKIAYQRTYAHDYAKIYAAEAKRKSGLNANDPTGPYNYANPWWHPWYQQGDLHTLQSVTKTITSVIIGMAVTRGEFPDINTPVLKFYDTTKVSHIDDRKRRMTIRHLLTMTAGFQWDEGIHYDNPKNDCSVMEASMDWIDYVINKPMSDEPGSRFNYNSGATELLADIFRKATGWDIEEYAVKNLFRPIGIDKHYWKRTPMGLVDTEGGLYLRPADLARIWYLFLHNGNWNGQQLVSQEWVRQSLTPAITVGGTTQYGYKWWLNTLPAEKPMRVWQGNGFGGQYPVILPDYDMIVVFNGWNIRDGDPSLRLREALLKLVRATESVRK
jgi:CubicO group peptidase (beta-lactamase class C family)